MEPLRLGIIGCGVIGSGAHLPDATRSPLVEVVAVADLIEERVRGAAERFQVPAACPSGAALLEDERVEAVVLAMPTGVRTPLAHQALAAGKHVLIEKPAAMNARQVRELIAARGDRTVGCCSPRFRMTPSALAAADFVAGGGLGDLRVVRCRAVLPAGPPPTSPPPPWRASKSLNGGGILVNWGCYDLDYLMGLTGYALKPQSVFAQAWPVAPYLSARVDPQSDAENHFITLIRCEGGAVITFERGEFTASAADEAWQILGTRGSLRLRMHPGKEKQILLDEADAATGVATRVLWQGDDTETSINQLLLEDFARAVRENRPPATSLERALVLMQITDGIYQSAETGRLVEVE